ncbi:C39 family peptidase [Limosilactobacillus reuteri]|uniref:C39 family peptidase n=1 Tax=Limosilactobacillus reuteri TaxID=1598 RepID=UPI001E40118D|nr:C39 family peptidase [Limosilactobacillus reuteri]MCC4422990.1 C39 family peptidase [Limosilactobacillus reuteri]
MKNKEHYKMFKKGKIWCYVLLSALTIAGTTFTAKTVSADSGSEPSMAVSVASTDSNQHSNSSIEQTSDSGSLQNDLKQQNVVNGANNVSKTTDTVSSEIDNNKQQPIAPQASTNSSTVVNGWTSDKKSYYDNGQLVKGIKTIGQNTYYFNDSGVLNTDTFYTNWGRTYYFGDDGARWDNRFYNNWGRTYYFQGDGARLDNGFYNNWGRTYYFQADGSRLDNNFYSNWGRTYYFQADGSRLDNNFYSNWGRTYYFQADGSRLDNGFYNNWGRTYYFGSDGARWDNRLYNNWGHNYWFGNDGALLTNGFIMLFGNDYYANNQGILNSVRYQSQFTPIYAPEGCSVAALQMLTSIKGINLPLYYAYTHLPQGGGVFGGGFTHIIPARDLVNYGRQWDSGLRDISGSSLSQIYNWVASGHPVIYYGFSAYEASYAWRNHAKVILGISNGRFHVYDPCYYSVNSPAGSSGSGPFGHGANSYLTWGQVAAEYNGSGAVTTV